MTFVSLESHPVVLFDGVCNFCNSSVNFILKRDSNSIFRFCPLQSVKGEHYLKKYNIDSTIDAIVLISSGRAYTHTNALLEITRNLNGFWPALYVLKLIPTFIRDFFYRGFAKRRYKWFGKKESCMIPQPQWKSRFIE